MHFNHFMYILHKIILSYEYTFVIIFLNAAFLLARHQWSSDRNDFPMMVRW